MSGRTVVIVAVWLHVAGSLACAFNVSTHQDMNREATNNDAAFESLLRQQFGFADGRYEEINRKQVMEWIIDGGEEEDGWIPLPGRFMNHFHDPLVTPWNTAGLEYRERQYESSAVWMQDRVNNGWCWQGARDQYYHALASPDRGDREFGWGNALRGIGQIMHLVEDAAVPEHVRNDPHGDEYICRKLHGLKTCHGNFEYWVSDPRRTEDDFGYSGAPPFDRNILYQRTDHSEAPIPVARLIDADTYDGSNPAVTLEPAIGLGEFSNANFFSQGTIPGPRQYPHPNVNTLEPTWRVNPTANTVRQYYDKASNDGLQVGPVAVASVFGDVCPVFSVDDVVWGATAKAVVPRAVDYAQGALDYFFRGRIDFGCDYADQDKPCLIKNLSSSDFPETLSGVFELWAEDPYGRRTLVSPPSWGERQCDANGCTVLNGVQVLAGQYMRVAGFTPPSDAARYVLVFRGKMGLEEDAVAGKVIPNDFLLMTLAATHAYHQPGAKSVWKKLSSGPLNLTLSSGWQIDRAFAGGAAVGDLLLAGFGLIDGGPWNPVWKSTDGGQSFAEISTTTYGNGVLDTVTWLGGSELLAAFRGDDYQGGVLYSNDLGATWGEQSTFDTYGRPGVLSIGGDGVLAQGVVTGDGSSLVRSTDKGRTWSEAKPFIDGAQLTCPNFEYTGDPVPASCRELYDAMDTISTILHPARYCVGGSSDGAICVGDGECSPDGLCEPYPPQYACPESVPAWIADEFGSGGCFDEWDLWLIYLAYEDCYASAAAQDQQVTPACYGWWSTNAMAWNQVDGEGRVILAGGEAGGLNSFGASLSWSGVWKSTDGGQHWRRVLTTDTFWGTSSIVGYNVISVAIAPSGEALAVGEIGAGPVPIDPDTGLHIWPKKLFRSTSAGETWTEIDNPEGSHDTKAGQGSVGVLYLHHGQGGP